MKGKILVVDDYSDWRELLLGLLERDGHQVETCGTMTSAIEYIDDHRDLDLVLLDIRLVETEDDNQDGMKLLARVRKRLAFTRVIMITGYGTMESQRRAFKKFQAFDFLNKATFNTEEFRRSVREAIEQAQRERLGWKDEKYMKVQNFENWQREKLDR